MAWQFDRPEAGYRVTHLDTGVQEQHSGRELLNDGLAATMPGKPDVAVPTYSRQP